VNFDDLTARQREVVEADERQVVVVGGAGTGKTTVALWAARRELEMEEAAGSRVLFLTFSRTAVDQIAARSRGVIAPVADRVEVATFHSLSFRLLRRFGHATGVTSRRPRLQSAAEAKLLGKDSSRLVYDDLAPLALKTLADPGVAALIARRWRMVICDEFQDTSASQWDLLESLGEHARLLLLGDNNQLIYGFLRSQGVRPERMQNAIATAGRVVELEPSSHRDPSGAIPALATSVRRRRFSDEPVTAAVQSGRLYVHSGVDDESVAEVVASVLDAAWHRGSRSFGVFGHSNQGVAELSNRLSERGVEHALVGLPDAEAEALNTMLVVTRAALGQADLLDVRVSFGTFLTACTRGALPPVARSLATGGSLPPGLERRFAVLEQTLAEGAAGVEDAAEFATETWPVIGVLAGTRPWARSVRAFRVQAKRAVSGAGSVEDQLGRLAAAIEQLRVGAMLESQRRRAPAVQVMNFHQTKGREADAIVLLYGDEDFLADRNDSEPYLEPSRLIYVALTRARREVTVVLGENPHPLVAPFAVLGLL
jgi:DNA helicase-2/ATP-dependent DNA helicase PcrA